MNSPIRMMHHDSNWQQEFEQTRSSILMACEGRVSVCEHVGSTAVAGLIAQPIIDLVVGVADAAEYPATRLCIEGLNFRKQPVPEWAEGAAILCKPRNGEATHCVYLMMEDDPLLRQMVNLTTWLRQDSEAQLRFETAKVHQWKAREGDPVGYSQSKAIFFAHAIDQMR